jgi:myo-inositol 2-dehydrogenase / D-chiro-inositol 1-dehydrogenase
LTLNIGLIGAGRIGGIHAANIANRIPNARLAAVADIDLEAAKSVADEMHVETAVADYAELLGDEDLQAIVICSATDTHTPIIMDAAAAGKHIFSEKPLDFDLGRIDKALQAVETAGVKLQVGFNRRFDPNFRKVKEMAAEGKIGEPHILRITSRDPEPPPLDYVKVSGGIFLDMTIHDFDMARYITGSEVEEVYVIGGVMIDPRIEEFGDLDTVIITLRFENGVIGTIDNSRKAVYGYDQRIELFGSKGMISTENETLDRHTYSSAEGIQSPLPLYFFLERYTESYFREMQSFVDSVENDTPLEVTGADGRAPVVIGLAARKSYDENRPVALKEISP